ncbi:carbohydrate ABC transporter permease [Mycoplasmopsis lipofaciens]|uniref:carbohydrate ABC transporter permease n=1 Tax=Mycoplasmopsis lipofaciens TaxID=114884 RepID=UPI0004871B62|nr:sugar ABC transporter permease [Mycoplasmopsis lipofaciens]
MNLNSVWTKFTKSSPSFHLLGAKKQSKKKVQALSGSIVDKETPAWKPLSLLIPTIIIITFFTIIPLFINLKYAFFDEKHMIGKDTTYHFTFQHFIDLFNDPIFAVGFRNSIMYGLIVLPFVMAISLIISSAIANVYRKWARGVWQTIFFLPYITSIVAVSLAFFQFFERDGLFNKMFGFSTPWLQSTDKFGFKALLPMLFQGIWSGLAFNILIFTTAMLSVDKNLYRSASIDGVGTVKQFFHITLPSIKSTTTFLITMGIIGGIKVFPLALFQNNPTAALDNGGATLMLYVYRWTSGARYAAASSAAIGLFVIGMIYTTIVRGGFNTIMKVSINLGEKNVWDKIKNSEVMIKYQTQKKQR